MKELPCVSVECGPCALSHVPPSTPGIRVYARIEVGHGETVCKIPAQEKVSVLWFVYKRNCELESVVLPAVLIKLH